MKLLTLKLHDFKGVRDFTLNADGENVNIYGANATGKSTIFDAIIWLLFDKNSEGVKNFDIKTVIDGEEMHHGEHTVEAAFLLDGKRITLKKVFHEKWVKNRGKLNPELTGNTTDYYVNDVPKKSGEYTRFISSIVDENIFKLLTDPWYFNEKLSWQERRKTLMELVGNIEFDDVIKSAGGSLDELTDLLQCRSVEDFAAMTKASLRKTNKELDEIPTRIKENNNMLIDVGGATEKDTGLAIKNKTVEVNGLNREIAELGATSDKDNGKTELKQKYQEKKAELLKAQNEFTEQFNVSRQVYVSKLVELRKAQSENEIKLNDLNERIYRMERQNKECNILRESLVKEFTELKTKTFNGFEIETICPTCGQELPPEKIEEAKARLKEQEAEFNNRKAEQLKNINERGRKNNEVKGKNEKEILDLTCEADILEKQINDRQQDIDAKEKALAALKMPGEKELANKRAELTGLLAKINAPAEPGENDELIAAKQKELDKANEELNVLHVTLSKIDRNKEIGKRIASLETREKELGDIFNSLTKAIYLADEFTRAKTALIDKKSASLFKMARFELFRNNVTNDGMEECCEVTYKGIRYSGLNSAAKLNIGLDIINVLAQKYNFTAPVVIDNAESVTDLIDTGDIQIIRLVVSKPDTVLRAEKVEKAAEGAA